MGGPDPDFVDRFFPVWLVLGVFLFMGAAGVVAEGCNKNRPEGPITSEECETVCAPCLVSRHSGTRCQCRNPRSLRGCE